MTEFKLQWDLRKLERLAGGMEKALARACSKAGATALRDMRAEASKRVRARKAIKVGAIGKTLVPERPRRASSASGMVWRLGVTGKPVSLTSYPHRQTRAGVKVQVNRGKWTLLRGAFLATMRNGHKGVWRRKGGARFPIREILGSRPVDALLHEGEAEGVAERGARVLSAGVARLLPLELAKGRGQGTGPR